MMTTQTYTESFEEVFIAKAKKDAARFVVEQFFDALFSDRPPISGALKSLFKDHAQLSVRFRDTLLHWKGKKAMIRHLRGIRDEAKAVTYEINTVRLVDGVPLVKGIFISRPAMDEDEGTPRWLFRISVRNGAIQSVRIRKKEPPSTIKAGKEAQTMALP